MRLLHSQNRITELMSIFVAQVKGATATHRTDICHVSEYILIPLFSELFGYKNLKNLNEESANYPGIDLGDEIAKVAFQVTATCGSGKVKDTLRKFVKYKLYEKYNRLIVYILSEKQKSYSDRGYRNIIQGRFHFNEDRDIWDYTDILKKVITLPHNKAVRIQRILEANFGEKSTPLFGKTGELQEEGIDQDRSRRVVENYRQFVHRKWNSQWADPARGSKDHRPPFIQDQGLRILKIRDPRFSPRRHLRPEHIRRFRADVHRLRRILEPPRQVKYFTDDVESRSESEPTIHGARIAWTTITREELIPRLIDDTSPAKLLRVVLATDAGIGKTTNMQWLHFAMSSADSPKLALLIDVAELPSNPSEFIANTVVSLLRQARGNDEESLSQEDAVALLTRLRSEGRLILLIDALDQIHMWDRACLQTLKHMLGSEHWKACPIVLGSRPFALERDWNYLFGSEMARGWQFVLVEEFTLEQQRAYLGSERYDAIPPDAREVLSIPRVLYYLRTSSKEDFDEIRTASDVYWFATSRLLIEGLRATEARGLSPNHARLLLSAIAFEMVASGNFREVHGGQMDEFQRALSERCKTYSQDCNLDWTVEKLSRVAAMNEFLSHGLLEAGCPQQIQWRNRSLQEFFAGLWLSKYSCEKDASLLWDWVYMPERPETGDYYWVWRFATEMPEPGRNAECWTRVMAPMYQPRDWTGNRTKRSTEMIYRSWETMRQYAGLKDATGNRCDVSLPLAHNAMSTFIAEFQGIFNGRHGPAARRTAKQLLTEFRSIPKNPRRLEDIIFWMGSPDDEKGRDSNEPLYRASIESPLELTCYLATEEQYALFDPTHTPWKRRRRSKRRRPVIHVTWYDAWVFCRWLGDGFRLPQEKEWEFACRAGTRSAYHFGDNGSRAYMRCNVCNSRVLIPVGCLKPNSWGLYDMHGLAWEWCENWYDDDPEVANHKGFMGEFRVVRGGAANTARYRTRSAERNYRDPADSTGLISFRIARDSQSTSANRQEKKAQ